MTWISEAKRRASISASAIWIDLALLKKVRNGINISIPTTKIWENMFIPVRKPWSYKWLVVPVFCTTSHTRTDISTTSLMRICISTTSLTRIISGTTSHINYTRHNKIGGSLSLSCSIKLYLLFAFFSIVTCMYSFVQWQWYGKFHTAISWRTSNLAA